MRLYLPLISLCVFLHDGPILQANGLSLHPRNQFTSDLVGEIRFLDKADVKNSNKLLSEGGTRVVSFKDMEGVSSLKDVKIQDVRGKEDDFKLDVNGFTYIKQAVKGAKAARDIDQLQSLYEQSAVEIVKKLTNAVAVVAYRSQVRNQELGALRVEGKPAPLPIHWAHSDYGVDAVEDLKDQLKNSDFNLVGDSEDKDTFNRLIHEDPQRLVLIKIWRPVKTITKDPLAMCDWSTLNPEVEGHAYRFGTKRISVVQWNWNANQRWYFQNEQTPEEAVVFIQYDQTAKNHMLVPHSAFRDPKHDDQPARVSIEVSMAAFVPKDPDIQKIKSSDLV